MNIFNTPINDWDYIIDSIGSDITINGTAARAIISNTKVEENHDDKLITTKSIIQRGNIINYADKTYFLISEVNDTRSNTDRYKAILRAVNQCIYFNFDGFLFLHPAIVEVKSLTLSTNNYFSYPDGSVQVTLQDNNDTNKIVLNQRFLTFRNVYQVTGIDKSKNGFIILSAESTTFNSNDDRDNEIADKDAYVLSINITNTETALSPGSTLQLTSELKSNDTVINNPGFAYTYTSSNTNVATIDNTGLITAISEGDVTFTLTLEAENNDTLTNTFGLNIENADNYTVTITGDDFTRTGQAKTYTAQVSNNGLTTSNTITWVLSNQDGSTPCSYASISEVTGNSCKVTGGNSSGYFVKLTASKSDDATIYAEKLIEIKGLW